MTRLVTNAEQLDEAIETAREACQGIALPDEVDRCQAIPSSCELPPTPDPNLDPICEGDSTRPAGNFGIGGYSTWQIAALVVPCLGVPLPFIPAYADLGSIQAPWIISLSGDTTGCYYSSNGNNGWGFDVAVHAEIVDAAYDGGIPFVSETHLTFNLPGGSFDDDASGMYDDLPGEQVEQSQCEAGRAVAIASLTAAAGTWVAEHLPDGALVPCTAAISLIPVSGPEPYLLNVGPLMGSCEVSINMVGAWSFTGTIAVLDGDNVKVVAQIQGSSVLLTTGPA